MLTFLTYTVILSVVGAWIYSAVFSLLALENRRYWRSHQKRPAPSLEQFPRVLITIPCKGMEHRLRENLTAFLHQDHPNFEVCFVVENAQDSACRLIKNVMSENRHVKSRIVVAGVSENSGQKIHNLLASTEKIPDGVEILVFADSDANPSQSWLRWLVHGIGAKGVGATTGYRWMIPARKNLANLLACTINNSVAAMLGRGNHFLVWGGSWAIHRSVFEAIGMRSAWNGALSDDLVASRVLQLSKLKITFEPKCVCTSVVNFDLSSFFEFARRQFLIVRKYQPSYWTAAIGVALISQIGYWGGLILGLSMLNQGNSAGWWLLASSTLLYGAGIMRAILRQNMGKIVTHEWRNHRDARNFDIAAGPLTGLVTLGMLFVSGFGSRFVWRSVFYHLGEGGRVKLLGRKIRTSPWILHPNNLSDSTAAPNSSPEPLKVHIHKDAA